MENKINIAELLKDCPQGMELDCTMYDNVKFDRIEDDNNYPITLHTEEGPLYLTKYGYYEDCKTAKCVIFPKGKTTWEGFVPPCKFKDGDIISDSFATCIFKGEGRIKGTVDYYCGFNANYFIVKDSKRFSDGHYGDIVDYRLATEEEKQKLFQAIKENGYRWNEETKMLEKLTPNFEDGDVLFLEGYKNYQYIFIFNKPECHGDWQSYCHLDLEDGKFYSIKTFLAGRAFHPRFATEEEKQHLFDAIKANGYKWNAEKKCLEKLNVPKFKIGVRIKKRKDYISGTIINISDDGFYKVEHQNGSVSYVNIAYQDEWELVPVEPKFKVGNRITNGKGSIKIGYIDDDYYYEIGRSIASRILIAEQEQWRLDKFDINTLVPFEDKVLVRDDETLKWCPATWGLYDSLLEDYNYVVEGGNGFNMCIPYENNEHLLGKTDDCDEYYKTWEE